MRKKEDKNFLLYVPKRRIKRITWEKRDDGNITLLIKRNSPMEKALAFMFNSPKVVSLDLDDLGSRVWSLCDGERNIVEIGKTIKNEFGEQAEPVYERLVEFIRILQKNSLIDLTEPH
jgi:hypothetical protein